MNLYALLIGINQYHPGSGVPPLSGCEKDVQNMQQFLERESYWPGRPRHIKTLLNKQATYQNIIAHFGEQHLLKAEKGDTVLIHYSGHGAREKAAPVFRPYFSSEKQETLICYDSRLDGHYDLADKELAVLLERIAKKEVELVLIMDCCHAGSISRSDAGRANLGKARQWDDRDITRKLETYLDGHFIQTVYSPTSKHLLLSACKKTEKAYELLSGQGSFTTHLLQVLEAHSSMISYADLYRHTRDLMLQVSEKQQPQFESYGGFQAKTNFLSAGKVSKDLEQYLFYEKRSWKLETNDLPALLSVFEQALCFEIYQGNKYLGKAHTTNVYPGGCTILPEVELDPNAAQTYRLRLVEWPLIPLSIDLQTDETGRAEFQANWKNTKALYFELEENAALAPYRLEVAGEEFKIVRNADQLRIQTIVQEPALAFKEAYALLENICRWEKVLTLASANKRAAVDLVLVQLDQDQNIIREIQASEIILDIFFKNGVEEKMPFRLEARNHTNETWYGLFLYLAQNYGIHKLYNEEIPAKSTVVLMEAAFELNGKIQAKDYFKLVTSRQSIKEYLFTQEGLALGKRQVGSNRGFEVRPLEEEDSLSDWHAVIMKCISYKREE